MSEKCVFQAAFSGRLHFLTGLMLHAQQPRAAFSLHVGPALPPQPCPTSRARQGHYTPKCGSAWEQHAMATTHSPAGEGRTCFLRSIWDKWVWLLSSSAFGMGRVWEVAAMAVAHAGSPCCHAGPRSTRQRHKAALGSGSWRTTESGCAHPCQCLADLLPLTPRGRCLLLPSRTWLQFGAG